MNSHTVEREMKARICLWAVERAEWCQHSNTMAWAVWWCHYVRRHTFYPCYSGCTVFAMADTLKRAGLSDATVDEILKAPKLFAKVMDLIALAGVGEVGCDASVGNLLYLAASRLKDSAERFRGDLVRYIASGKIKSNVQVCGRCAACIVCMGRCNDWLFVCAPVCSLTRRWTASRSLQRTAHLMLLHLRPRVVLVWSSLVMKSPQPSKQRWKTFASVYSKSATCSQPACFRFIIT